MPWGASPPCAAAQPLTAAFASRLDAEVSRILAATGAPSVSIAVATPGRPVWTKAYGAARLQPEAAAQPSTRYGVGSISKQFTAAALLILQSRGKLSLDDPISRWFPDLTDADKISVRQVLTHTSGYEDFYPEDYTPAALRRPTSPEAIMAAGRESRWIFSRARRGNIPIPDTSSPVVSSNRSRADRCSLF